MATHWIGFGLGAPDENTRCAGTKTILGRATGGVFRLRRPYFRWERTIGRASGEALRRESPYRWLGFGSNHQRTVAARGLRSPRSSEPVEWDSSRSRVTRVWLRFHGDVEHINLSQKWTEHAVEQINGSIGEREPDQNIG
jgi:hypothetical protein